MKRWLLIGGGVVVVIIAGLFYLYSSLGSLIKMAVEKYGSEITQAKVRLNKAELSATSGTGALRGLFVGNPQGFKTASAFQLGEISLTVDIGTITSDPVVIKEIIVSAPEVTYELGPQGSNIDAIKRNVDAYTKAGKDGATTEKTESAGEAKKAGRKVVIENLYIRNGRVKIGSTLSDKTMNVPLPDIHLTNIGKQKGGATPGEVAEKIIGALGQSANTAIASVDTSKVLGEAKKQFSAAAGGIQEKGKSALGGVKGLFGD